MKRGANVNVAGRARLTAPLLRASRHEHIGVDSTHWEDLPTPTFELGSALLNGSLPAHTFNGGYQGASETSEPDLLVQHLMSAGSFSREEAERWARMI